MICRFYPAETCTRHKVFPQIYVHTYCKHNEPQDQAAVCIIEPFCESRPPQGGRIFATVQCITNMNELGGVQLEHLQLGSLEG